MTGNACSFVFHFKKRPTKLKLLFLKKHKDCNIRSFYKTYMVKYNGDLVKNPANDIALLRISDSGCSIPSQNGNLKKFLPPKSNLVCCQILSFQNFKIPIVVIRRQLWLPY